MTDTILTITAKQANAATTGTKVDTPSERVARLYASPGGPLMAWLIDERHRRGEDYKAMARHLGVTYGYINQLRSGVRRPEHISQEMTLSCARYLGVPPIVVMVVAGKIRMSDFLQPREEEEASVSRAVQRMLNDPAIRQMLPADVQAMPLEAQRTLVMMYGEVTGHDLFGMRQLPEMVRWLQRAATLHDESTGAAVRGHRDAVGMR